ncbi:MAG: hypothetical protein IKM47_04440, partial [Bacteroidaceae bacterium]|nr:hypothetical protein [Bacteroidaceae bacterium]
MHKIKTILTLLLLLALHMQLPAQRTTVKDMRNRIKRLQQQIKEKESILYTSEKDIKSKIKSLQLLTSQADEQKTLIDLLSKELKAIDAEIKLLDGEITAGEAKVEKSKKEYAAALSRARRYGTLQDKLLFIISADDFNKMLHRYRYTREYMNAHRKQAEQLKENIRSLQAKRAEADSVRSQKNLSLEEQKQEQTKLKTLEDKQRTLLAELKRENKAVKNELDRRRKELNGLNAAIDKAITEELEARRKAEEERKRAQAKKTPSKKEKTSKKETTSAVTTKEKPSSKAKEPPTHSAEAIKKQSGSFLQNKGRLPVPVTGPYRMINSYGLQRATTGKGNVSIDLGGIT